MSLDDTEGIQEFLDSLKGMMIMEFKVVKWETDPAFRIVTDKMSFTLHSNDIGVFIDEIANI